MFLDIFKVKTSQRHLLKNKKNNSREMTCVVKVHASKGICESAHLVFSFCDHVNYTHNWRPLSIAQYKIWNSISLMKSCVSFGTFQPSYPSYYEIFHAARNLSGGFLATDRVNIMNIVTSFSMFRHFLKTDYFL